MTDTLNKVSVCELCGADLFTKKLMVIKSPLTYTFIQPSGKCLDNCRCFNLCFEFCTPVNKITYFSVSKIINDHLYKLTSDCRMRYQTSFSATHYNTGTNNRVVLDKFFELDPNKLLWDQIDAFFDKMIKLNSFS